jgi:folate-binding protein YgfZ
MLSLGHRRVVAIVGRDARVFVQGLFTNSVLAISPAAPVYGGFLNGNGRVVTDAVVFESPVLAHAAAVAAPVASGKLDDVALASSLVLEVDAAVVPKLVSHLNGFKMRADVRFVPLPSAAVAARIEQGGAASATSADAGCSIRDPRLGLCDSVVREYSLVQSDAAAAAAAAASDATPQLAPIEYRRHLYERGVAEGAALWQAVRLPFEANLDIAGGIHFNKGCYIGQELVQRTKTQLVSRKRVVPFQCDAHVPPLGELVAVAPDGVAGTVVVGKVIDCVATGAEGAAAFVGVATVRLADAIDPDSLGGTLALAADPRVRLQAWVPSWWPDDEIEKCIPLKGVAPPADEES